MSSVTVKKQNEKPWVIFHINYAFSPGSNLCKHGNNSTCVQTRVFTWWIDWLSTLARLPWKASASAWWGTQCHYWVSRCFPADHLPTPGKWKTEKKEEKKNDYNWGSLDCNANSCKKRPEVFTFFGQMMCGANIVARLIADILLTCWLRAVWYSRSSNNFNRLRLAGGSNMKSSWKASIWRSLSGTFVLFPSSSKRVNSGHSEKKELL